MNIMPDTPQFILLLSMALKGVVSPSMPAAINGAYFASPTAGASTHAEMTIAGAAISTPDMTCKPLAISGSGTRYQGRFSCLPTASAQEGKNPESVRIRLSLSLSQSTGALTVVGLDGEHSKHVYFPASASKGTRPDDSNLPKP